MSRSILVMVSLLVSSSLVLAQEVDEPLPQQAQPQAQPFKLKQSTDYRPRTGLVIAGAAVNAGIWTINLAAGIMIGNEWSWMAMPMIGPFIAVGSYCSNYKNTQSSSYSRGYDTCTADPNGRGLIVLSVLDSLVQIGSFAMMVGGLVSKKPVSQKYSFSPSVSQSGASMAFATRF